MSDNKTPQQRNYQAKDVNDDKVDSSFERLSKAFETSARRWELIVYPSLFGFILLAGYGFPDIQPNPGYSLPRHKCRFKYDGDGQQFPGSH